MAETLIFRHGRASDSEICRAVQLAGYEASREEVVAGLAIIAEEDNWSFLEDAADRTYFFEEDTDEVCHVYLERNGLFWEAAVVGKHLFRSDGQVGQLGRHRSRELESNRYAFHQLRNLLRAREQQGYELAEDIRPDLATRLAYWDVLRRQPWEIRFIYRTNQGASEEYCFVWNRDFQGLPLIDLLAREQFELREAPAKVVLHNQEPLEEPSSVPVRVSNHELQEARFVYGPDDRVHLQAYQFRRPEFMARVRLLTAAAIH